MPRAIRVAAGRADAAPHLRFKARIPDIHRWSTDDPYRYMLAIILRDDRTGRHIMTVGRRCALPTTPPRAGGAGAQCRALWAWLAALDSIPVTADSREGARAALRAAGANAVIAPAGVDPDTGGATSMPTRPAMLCRRRARPDAAFAADPQDAERPQAPTDSTAWPSAIRVW